MAMQPMASAESVRIENCITSVMTTLIIPPLMTYSDVTPMIRIA